MATRNSKTTTPRPRRSTRVVLETALAKAEADVTRYTDLLNKAKAVQRDAQKKLDAIKAEEKATAEARIAEMEAELERLRAIAAE